MDTTPVSSTAATALEEIRERSAAALEFPLSGFAEDSIRACTLSAMDVPRLLAAVEAALKETKRLDSGRGDYGHLVNRHEAAAVFRAAITAALTGKEASDE
jgi:hypothetical protein